MKKIYSYIVSLVLLLGCNPEKANNKDNSIHHEHETSVNNNSGKTYFEKIQNLPPDIENIFDIKPSKEVGFYKLSFPRKDLKVSLDGIAIEPGLAFTSWLAFLPSKDSSHVMLMGDLVLLETEFPKVLQELHKNNIDVAAIHNHLLNEKPKIMYMHVSAMGNQMEILKKMKEVLLVTATPLKSEQKKEEEQEENWAKTEELIGYRGKQEGKLLKFGIPRKEKIVEHGMELPEMYGVNSVINFQKVGDKAAVTGDFVLRSNEIKKVIEILTHNNITVTALHNHMLFEEPRLFFLHFWGVDNPEKLAKALNEVLISTNHESRK